MLCPFDGIFKTIVAPEYFAIDHKRWSAENAESMRLFACAQEFVLCFPGMCQRKDMFRIRSRSFDAFGQIQFITYSPPKLNWAKKDSHPKMRVYDNSHRLDVPPHPRRFAGRSEAGVLTFRFSGSQRRGRTGFSPDLLSISA